MHFNSTQNNKNIVNSAQAIAQGLSPDGGLFVPQSFPKINLQELINLTYNGRAKSVLGLYLTDYSAPELANCVDNAYNAEKFGSDNPTPITAQSFNGNQINFLELWHGPTSAFKDMALQILPHLLTLAYKKEEAGKQALILVATSGDTGKAALEGFKDVPNTQIAVFYPENGVSEIQKFQMNSQAGENVLVCGINGNFDDAQTAVKRLFNTQTLINKLAAKNTMFSSANSINFGRLVPQVVYYISAYCDMVNGGKIAMGEQINVVVPTGNFGNILAAYYAKRMGLPIGKLICASNSNNVLAEFINTGVYNKNRKFFTTISPSMDILVSSNLERLLYHLCGENSDTVAAMMQSLKTNGSFTVADDVKAEISELFYGNSCTEEETQQTIKQLFEQSCYLCDPHTAVAVNVYDKYAKQTGDCKTPVLLVSTASPYKFPAAVLDALDAKQQGVASCKNEFEMLDVLNSLTGAPVPAPILNLKTQTKRFANLTEVPDMEQFLTEKLGLN